jgi:hypothetical protein
MKPLLYTDQDSESAEATWKASCGPHSLAAACGKRLEEVRAALVNYRGWMNPTQMKAALGALGQGFALRSHLRTQELCSGINRVQWEGPWLNPGVPPRVAYYHTHWVAHFDGWVLCTACAPAKWIPVEIWRSAHLNDDPPSPFHITHHYEFVHIPRRIGT